MVKRMLMGAGLTLALLGGAATAAHASGVMAAQRATIHADHKVLATEPTAADGDTNAPCVPATATSSESGNCQDSQDTGGPEDSTGAGTPDTDTMQSGDQSSPD